VVASSQIARVEATLALHQVTIAAADEHQHGVTAAVARLVGVALALAVALQAGEVAVVAALLAGEETAGVQPTAAVMVAVQLMVEQQLTVALLRTEARHRMVEAQHMAATTATAPHTVASTRAVVRLDGEGLDQATQHPSRTYPHLHLEPTMHLHRVRMRHQRLVVMAPTLHLLLADPWMLLRLATTLRRRQETVMVSRLQLRQHRVHGISPHRHRAARILDTIEKDEIV
jgi:hypothetical protein